jgi:hypothetical protein
MAAPEPSSPPPETLAFIYDWGWGALDRQLAAADALDAKMAQALAAGSILLGLPAASGISGGATAAFLGCATAAFLVLAALAVHALWVRRWRAPLSPSQAWREYWADEAEAIRWTIVADTSEAYEENEGLLDSKRRSLRWALSALGAEAVLVGAAAIAAAL